MCKNLGSGALTAKIDQKNAFRLCPIHKEDWYLLGIHWHNQFYIDKCLPWKALVSLLILRMAWFSHIWPDHLHGKSIDGKSYML